MKTRALFIALVGPALQAAGFLWEAAHVLLVHWDAPLSGRHLLFEPGILLIAVGLAVSLVCIPVAIEVAQASAEDVALPDFEPEAMEQLTVRQARGAR